MSEDGVGRKNFASLARRAINLYRDKLLLNFVVLLYRYFLFDGEKDGKKMKEVNNEL